MQLLNLLKKYIVSSQIFVAFCGTSLAIFFMLDQNLVRFPTIFLIFITYWSGYLYTKYQYSRNFKKILLFNIFCGIISALLIFLNHNEIRLLKWLTIVILGLLYNSAFLEKFIRKIPLLKVFYVGFTWALINSWLILPEFNFVIFFISWLFVTALILPFDIRDMHDDKIITFPKIIGIQNTKYLAYFLIFAAATTAIFYLKTSFAVAFFLTQLISFPLIYFSKNTNDDLYFSFWVELCSALPLFFFIIAWLIN